MIIYMTAQEDRTPVVFENDAIPQNHNHTIFYCEPTDDKLKHDQQPSSLNSKAIILSSDLSFSCQAKSEDKHLAIQTNPPLVVNYQKLTYKTNRLPSSEGFLYNNK